MNYGDVERIVSAHGFEPVRQSGSHQVWRHPDGRSTVLAPHGRNHDIPRGTLQSIIRQTGIDPEFFHPERGPRLLRALRASRVVPILGAAGAAIAATYAISGARAELSNGRISEEAFQEYQAFVTVHAVAGRFDPTLIGNEIAAREWFDNFAERHNLTAEQKQLMNPSIFGVGLSTEERQVHREEQRQNYQSWRARQREGFYSDSQPEPIETSSHVSESDLGMIAPQTVTYSFSQRGVPIRNT